MAPPRPDDEPPLNFDVPVWVQVVALALAFLTAAGAFAGCWWVGAQVVEAIRAVGPAED